MARAARSGGVVIGCLAFAWAAQAGSITFQFNYLDAAGTGFKAGGATGAERQAALTTAGTMFSDMFSSFFSNSGTIVLNVTGSDDPASSTLASAASYFVAGATTFGGGEVIRTKLQGGGDLTPGGADGMVDVNFGQAWDLSATGAVPNSEYDFFAVLDHEFTHALGFGSLINQDGSSALDEFSMYDQFLADGNNNKIVDPATMTVNGNWATASDGGSSMFFDGTNAMDANGGLLVGLYSPTTWVSGTSVSHLDDGLYPDSMMHWSTSTGDAPRTYSAINVGIMQDLGYTRDDVPEPGTVGLLGFGLWFMVGRVGRRRKP